ncbi:ABC transporter ATP-binding protein [Hypericibacter adhaerens]|jgi:branched-chain amino acid transport system ATP-binding protein|uniref:ABC transporter ATP-binding protein n=1 Tax=Hypericibacter adhaerens TaxID=2602016 RepID=A0A5J6N3B1_9PROT|nr:ABC transporter ATP-binding protein [Hypericibacter adhaerens]QEX24259.1 ABC transporter ATP-binding protein [Hypericibacter adhaerens]
MSAQLSVTGLTKRFGGLVAVDALDLAVEKGAIHGLIGPNGAGKTTLFSMISGTLPVSAGRVEFEGTDVTGLPPHRTVSCGMVRTFQRSAVFHHFTVIENLLLGTHLLARPTVLGSLFGPHRRFSPADLEAADETLAFIGLADYRDAAAETLPLGHQRSLGIGIALAAKPRLLMLDEPAAGMNRTESETLMQLIRDVRDRLGATVLLVEHDMQTVMGLCERITVLNFGRKLAEGSPVEIAANPAVIEAYLGLDEDAQRVAAHA